MVILSDYLQFEKGDIMKTEGSYVTKAAQVQGSLIFTKDFVQFIPLTTKVNQHVRNTIYIKIGGRPETFQCNGRLLGYPGGRGDQNY